MESVKLFEPGQRTRLTPMREGESHYSFIDESVWEACASYRELANEWVANLPASHQRNIVIGVRKASSAHRYAALMLELVVGSLLRNLGFGVEPHPTLSNTAKVPDFRLVGKHGNNLGYVEVTAMGPSNEAAAGANRATAVYAAIDAIKMPAGCILAYNLLEVGKNSPPIRRVIQNICKWIDNSNLAAVDGPIKEIFSEGDWLLELTLHNFGSDKIYGNAIHIVGPRAAWIDVIEDLKGALRGKDERYGTLAAPFLLVVGDARGRSWGRSISADLSQALFGSELIEIDFHNSANWGRKCDGFWLGVRGPKNQHVSGVLFFPDCGIWGMRNPLHKPLLAVNPWATHPLPREFMHLVRMELDNSEWVLRGGEEIADLIGLPQIWPPSREPIQAES